MFPRAVLDRIVAGEVDLAFRRWARRAHVPGGSQRTQVGVIAFTSVDVVDADEITAAEAERAGTDLPRLQKWLAAKGAGDVYRIGLRFAGADPRVELRSRSQLSTDEVTQITSRLEAFDRRSTRGPWTREHLELIKKHPEVRAEDLAGLIGRDKLPFKADIRRLKELGLTESLPVGYRLSPRGAAVLTALEGS